MRCKECGQCHDLVWFEAVRPELAMWESYDVEKPILEPFYKRWACIRCGRYHFPDGTIYRNPYAKEQHRNYPLTPQPRSHMVGLVNMEE